MTKSYVGDTGTSIILDCGQDVSSATVRTIEAKKPDGTTVSWTAVASGLNAIKFDTLLASLDQAGKWKLQAHVTLPTGKWLGETVELVVYDAFK